MTRIRTAIAALALTAAAVAGAGMHAPTHHLDHTAYPVKSLKEIGCC